MVATRFSRFVLGAVLGAAVLVFALVNSVSADEWMDVTRALIKALSAAPAAQRSGVFGDSQANATNRSPERTRVGSTRSEVFLLAQEWEPARRGDGIVRGDQGD